MKSQLLLGVSSIALAIALVDASPVVADTIIGDTTSESVTNTTTQAVTGNLILGNQGTGNGAYTLTTDSGVLTVTVDPTRFPLADPNTIHGTGNGNLIVGEQGTGSFTQGLADQSDNPSVTIDGDLGLGHQGGGNSPSAPVPDSTGTYTLNSGTLTVGGKVEVGGASQGSGNLFTQNGGTLTITGAATAQPNPNPNYVGLGDNNSAGTLFVAGGAGPDNDGGNGTYQMNGGTITAGAVEVGHTGTGIFNQSAGSVNAGSLSLGNVGANGTYNLSGTGSIAVSLENVGFGGIGVLNQSGGTNSVGGTLDLGFNGTKGTFNLSGGTLTVGGQVIVGDGATGDFNQTGGSHTVGTASVPANLVLGSQSGVTGTYELSDPGAVGTTLTVNGNVIIGDAGTGTFTQTGGTHTVAGDLILGNTIFSNGTGTYAMSGAGSVLQVGGSIVVGKDAETTNTFQQSDGTVTAGGLTLGSSGSNLNPTGIYKLTGGGVLHITGDEVIGGFGHGEFTQDTVGGGLTSHTVDGTMRIGDGPNVTPDSGSPPRSGSYTLNAGSLTTGSTIVASQGTGSFTQNGGSHTTGSLIVGDQNIPVQPGCGNPPTCAVGGPAKGTYTLNSGTLTTQGTIVGNSGNGTFNQTGGSHTVGTVNSGADLVVGAQSGSTGTYNLSSADQSNPASLQVFGNATLGRDTGSTGSLTIGTQGATTDATSMTVSATSNTDGNMTVGDAGNGTLTIHSGSLNVANTVQIGVNSVGKVVQDGGSFTAGFVNLSLPVGAGSSTYALSKGSLTVNADLNVAGGGAGATFTQSGGSVQVGGTAFINGNGLYDQKSGSLAVGTQAALDLNTPSNLQIVAGTYHLGSDPAKPNSATADVFGNVTLQNNASMTIDNGATLTVHSSNNNPSGGQIFVGDSGSASITQNSGKNSNVVVQLGSFSALGGTGNYTLNGGELDTTNTHVFDGLFKQTNGTNNSFVVDVGGTTVGQTGTYSMSGGNLNTSGMIVGDAPGNVSNQGPGVGIFNHTGGTVTVTAPANVASDLTVANLAGDNGSYNLGGNGSLVVGGSENVILGKAAGSVGAFNFNTIVQDNATMSFTGTNQQLVVGDAGKGTFTQGGGDLNLKTSGAILIVGRSVGGDGTYNLNGGTLEDDAFIGDAGTGTFNNTGGVHTVSGDLTLGNQATGKGTYTLSGSGALKLASVSGTIFVGGAGKGTFTQQGGTTVSASSISVGNAAGGTGVYNLSGTGSLQVTGISFIGAAGDGTFNQSGGSHSADIVSIGNNTGGHGTYNLTGGTLATTHQMLVGDTGTGVFNQGQGGKSGTVTVGTNLSIGAQSGGPGTYNLGGTGSLTVGGNEHVGQAAVGTFNQSGGSNTIAGKLSIGDQPSAAGSTYNLSAGTLKAGSFANADFFNQTGGSATITGNATSVGAVLLSNGGKLGVGGSYTQSSGFTLLNNATLSAGGGVAVNGGLFGGFGTVNGNVTVSHAAIRIGASPDALTINGNFAQTGGTITFEVDSDGHGGFLTSTLVLGQNFTFELQDAKVDFSFQNGADAIAFEDSGEFDLDTFFRIADANAPGGTDPLSDILAPGAQLDSLFTGDTFVATSIDQSLNDVVTFDANGGAPVLTVASSVPEPESLALLLPGLSLVFFLRRSRRARALVLAG